MYIHTVICWNDLHIWTHIVKPAVLLEQAIWAIVHHTCKISKPTSTLEKNVISCCGTFLHSMCPKKTTNHAFVSWIKHVFFNQGPRFLAVENASNQPDTFEIFPKRAMFSCCFQNLEKSVSPSILGIKKSMIGRYLFGLPKVSQTFSEFVWSFQELSCVFLHFFTTLESFTR